MSTLPTSPPPKEAAERCLREVVGEAPERSLLVRYGLRSLEVFAYWMPVWVPLVLLAQIGVRGYRPAVAERARLSAHQLDLEDRLEQERGARAALEAERKALNDPIYLERLRRNREGE